MKATSENTPARPNEDRERLFHDEWAESIDPAEVMVEASFTASTAPEAKWIAQQLGNLQGKRLLELGSGAGEGAVYFACQGARVMATDLSPGMLKVVEKVATIHGVDVETRIASAEDLSQFSANSFDVVYAANLLHHVAIDRCLAEVERVLKPGGVAAFWDPLAYNPVINIYRLMASSLRTPDEHPLRRSDLALFRKRFSQVKTRFFWLTALAVFLKFFVLDRIHPSQDRYWKRILTEEPRLRWFSVPLMKLDRLLLTLFPFFGYCCWNIAILARK